MGRSRKTEEKSVIFVRAPRRLAAEIDRRAGLREVSRQTVVLDALRVHFGMYPPGERAKAATAAE